ncbi:MlaD family protein [Nocardia higoensis]|uniref:MlaD family protein n=1 Tax=Nocardia higoensis TaxID=228599 RepID=UPI0002FA0F7D|nr:MCE family protein [Nocardia higoensis]
MLILFDTDGRGPTRGRLFRRGVVLALVAALAVAGMLAKSSGTFDSDVEVTAILSDIGDGLPRNSDVKFRGVLVGTVEGVTTTDAGTEHRVAISLKPEYHHGIPRTVTARVVPSNVFAVSSVQLVDNGWAPALAPHAEIPQDRSLSTVKLQTALTRLREIIAATARAGADRTVGVLAAVAAATDRRGEDLVRAGAQLERITAELTAFMQPDGGPSMLSALSEAVRGLGAAAPDLLDALHHAVTSMRTVAEQRAALTDLITASSVTADTIGTAMDDHTDQIIDITTEFEPVVGIFADAGQEFAPIVVRLRRISDVWFTEFWDPEAQIGVGKLQLRSTPHIPYTRAQCPRYGEMAGPSCATAPEVVPQQPLPESMDPRSVPLPVLPPEVRELIGRLIGGGANAAESFLGGLLTNGPVVSGGAP